MTVPQRLARNASPIQFPAEGQCVSLRKQATSLAILHAADVLQPLLVLPYAARVLQPEHFGQYAYAMSIGQLAATVVGYGFHWTGQRAAAAARHEPAALAAIFAEVIATKVMLFLVVLGVGLVAADGVLAIGKPMFLCAMLTAVGGIFFPDWLFIAIEQAWRATLAVVIARALALVLFLTLVTSPEQIQLAVASQASIPLVAGIVSLPFIIPVGLSGFKSVSLSSILKQLRGGWRGFLFTLVETALLVLPVPLVQHFAGFTAAGQYSVAEKFVGVTRPFFRVVSETFLPRVAFYAQHDPAEGIALIRKSMLTVVVGAALSLSLFFIAPYFIILFFGEGFAGAIPILRVMSVIPLLMNVSICTSNLYMFNYGHERAWVVLTIVGLVIFLAVAYLLSFELTNGAIAVAIGVIARQGVVLAVSAGFFVAFAATRMQRLPVKNNPTGTRRGSSAPAPLARLVPSGHDHRSSKD